MKKKIKINNLECANCAAKMQDGINKISGVNSATVNFMFQKLTIDADDDKMDSIIAEAEKLCQKIESGCSFDL